jgi:hypothetical protein
MYFRIDQQGNARALSVVSGFTVLAQIVETSGDERVPEDFAPGMLATFRADSYNRAEWSALARGEIRRALMSCAP